MDSHKPLAGIKVVELATAATGPVAATIMAEQGADVIKVEPPGIGDAVRHLGTTSGGVSSFFASCNRGKRALSVDLKHPEGVEIVRQLSLEADVLISNYRTGVLERLGLGSEVLRQANPTLIYVAINGFGIEGPLANAPAYDHILQAFSGMGDVQGMHGEFELVRTIVVDSITAYHACQAATAALFQRSRSGEGQHVDISMLDTSLYFLWPGGMMNHTFLDEGAAIRPDLKPTYTTLSTANGYIAMAALTDAHWHGLFRATGREDMIDDPRYGNILGRSTHLEELYEAFEDAFKEMTSDEVQSLLLELDIPGTPCFSIDEMIDHPQVEAVGAVQTQAHPVLGRYRSPAHPARFASKRMAALPAVGLIGEATRDVLGELGYTGEQIDDLVGRGVAAAPDV